MQLDANIKILEICIFWREYGDTVFENSLVVARDVAEELEMNSDEMHFPKATANCL